MAHFIDILNWECLLQYAINLALDVHKFEWDCFVIMVTHTHNIVSSIQLGYLYIQIGKLNTKFNGIYNLPMCFVLLSILVQRQRSIKCLYLPNLIPATINILPLSQRSRLPNSKLLIAIKRKIYYIEWSKHLYHIQRI